MIRQTTAVVVMLMILISTNTDAWGQLTLLQEYNFDGGSRDSSVGAVNSAVDVGAPGFTLDRVEVSEGGEGNYIEVPFTPDYNRAWKFEFDFNFSGGGPGVDKTVYWARDSSNAGANGMLWDCDGSGAHCNNPSGNVVFMGVTHVSKMDGGRPVTTARKIFSTTKIIT